MLLAQRITRSKAVDQARASSIDVKESGDALIALQSAKQLQVQPIWKFPIDEIEGKLYASYISDNPGYSQIYVRSALADMLRSAAQSLPSNISLIVRAGHRPLSVQNELLQMLVQQHKLKNPVVSEAEALDFARTYVSDPKIKLPPHCCGAAVDIDAIDIETGKLLDFGCPINTDSDIAFLHTDKITRVQKANRTLLLSAMLQAGFASFTTEWWHYSYGDTIWANFYMEPYALYGLIEPELTNQSGESNDTCTRNTHDKPIT